MASRDTHRLRAENPAKAAESTRRLGQTGNIPERRAQDITLFSRTDRLSMCAARQSQARHSAAALPARSKTCVVGPAAHRAQQTHPARCFWLGHPLENR